MAKTTIYYFHMYNGSFHLISREIEADDHNSMQDQFSAAMMKIDSHENSVPFSFGLNILIEKALSQRLGEPGVTAKSSAEIPPICPDHGTPMDVSRFTGEGAQVSYYCKRKNGNAYCTQQADVLPGGVVRPRSGRK